MLSTDEVVHELYRSDEVRHEVVERFGPEVAPEGTIDRAAVARAVFASEEDRQWLEGMLWPRVGIWMSAWRERQDARVPAPRALVVEVPLLFEAGLEAGFDATIAVVAPEELRAERADERGHHSVDERTARQLSQEEKARRADYVVENSASIEVLQRKLSDVLDMLES